MYFLLRNYIVYIFSVHFLLKILNWHFTISLTCINSCVIILACWVTYDFWKDSFSVGTIFTNIYLKNEEINKQHIYSILANQISEKKADLSKNLKISKKIAITSRRPTAISNSYDIIMSPVNVEPLRNAIDKQIIENFDYEPEKICVPNYAIKKVIEENVLTPKRRQNIEIVLRKMPFYETGKEIVQNRLIYFSILKMDFSFFNIDTFYK